MPVRSGSRYAHSHTPGRYRKGDTPLKARRRALSRFWHRPRFPHPPIPMPPNPISLTVMPDLPKLRYCMFFSPTLIGLQFPRHDPARARITGVQNSAAASNYHRADHALAASTDGVLQCIQNCLPSTGKLFDQIYPRPSRFTFQASRLK